MKKRLSTFVLLLAFATLNAQPHFDLFRKSEADGHRAFINRLLSRQALSPNTAQKPTGVRQRLIAQTMISAQDGVQDTMTYKYSGGRGSMYNHNVIDNFGYRDNFTSDYLSGPYFETSAERNDVLADSVIQYSGAVPFIISTAFYRTDNQIDSFFNFYEAGPSTTTDKTIQVYNTNGYMTQYASINDYMLPPDFDTNSMRRLWYITAAGTQLWKDTVYMQAVNDLQPYYTTTYHYNSQHNLDSIAEYEIGDSSCNLLLRTTISYDADNRVNKVTQMDYSPFGAATLVDTFGYTGDLPFFTFYERRRYEGGFDYSGIRITKHIGSNNLPDTAMVYVKNSSSFNLSHILKYAYNNFNNPDSIVSFAPNGTYAGRYNFYYETYDGSVGIEEAPPAHNFKLYPNPFRDKVYVEWFKEEMHVKISLVNIAGQRIFTGDAYLARGGNNIELSGIAGGNYLLIIQDDKGTTYKGRISKW